MIVERLDGPFGVRVKGLDLKTGADAALIRRLAELLYAHRIVAISGQSLTEDQYLAFGRNWGRPHPHALVHKRMAGYPEMMIVGNTFKRAANDTPAVFWHTDQSYEAEPASCTMLYAVMAPETGGETAFADMVAAYEALDDETKRRIEPLEVMHFYGAASGRDGENRASALLEDQRRSVPPVPHRLVRRHPVTGHKALYAVAGTPFAIKGMDDAEGAALLERLKRHCLQPQFTFKYKYSIGDIAIWDTLSTIHSATPIKPATGPKDSRLMWRISCKGLPGVFAGAAPADRAA